MLKATPRGGGEGTAGLQLRLYIHHLKAIFLGALFLGDQERGLSAHSTGQRGRDRVSLSHGKGGKDSLSDFAAGVAADRVAAISLEEQPTTRICPGFIAAVLISSSAIAFVCS